MEIEDVLTRTQMKRLKRNTAIREEHSRLIASGMKKSDAVRRIADRYELSEIMVRQIIRKKTAL